MRCGGVSVLRCTVMNPFLVARRGRVDYLKGFARNLREVLQEVL